MAVGEISYAVTRWPGFVGARLDVLAVQETKLGASSDVAVDGLAVLRKDVRRGARGLATFVPGDFVAVREPRLEHNDTMLVFFSTLMPEVWVLSVYRRPSATAAEDGALYGSLAAVSDVARAARAALLVVGDLNARAFDGAPQLGGPFARATRAAEPPTPASVRLGR